MHCLSFHGTSWHRLNKDNDKGTSKNPALRLAQCERHIINQRVPFVLSVSKHEWNGFFEVPISMSSNEYRIESALDSLCRPSLIQMEPHIIAAKFDLMKIVPARHILETALANGDLKKP